MVDNGWYMVIIWLMMVNNGWYMVIIWLMMVNNNLVGGWANPSDKYKSQLGWWQWKNKTCSKPPTSYNKSLTSNAFGIILPIRPPSFQGSVARVRSQIISSRHYIGDFPNKSSSSSWFPYGWWSFTMLTFDKWHGIYILLIHKIMYHVSCTLFISYNSIQKYGVPPNHPFIDGFSRVNHLAIGVPPFTETTMSKNHDIFRLPQLSSGWRPCNSLIRAWHSSKSPSKKEASAVRRNPYI